MSPPTQEAQDLRIVSLIASSTEIVCALGLEDKLVGRSHECDFPPSVKNLPVTTGPKFEPDGTSYEIDQRVRAVLQESLSVYRVDAELLDHLAPTHIITQSQCEVCAVSLKDVEQAACDLIHSKPKIISLEPNCLDDVFADIMRVGEGLGYKSRAEDLVSTLKRRLIDLQRRCASQPLTTIACIEWIEPLMAAGNWTSELIEMANGKDLFGIKGKHSPTMQWQQIADADPEVILVTPCGFDIERTLKEMHLLKSKPNYGNLRAVKNNRVFVADGNQFFNRPGPRVVETLEILAEVLHFPKQAKHLGTGWVPYPS